MKLQISFFSQYSKDITEEWQSRACAISCLKMILDFYNKKNDPMDLIKEGLIISEDLAIKGRSVSGYTKEFGWGHDLLVILLANQSIPAYRQEFKGKNNILMSFGIEKIKKCIENKKPVLISMAKDIRNPALTGHIVIVFGFEEKEGVLSGFYINDPEKKTELEGEDIFVKIEDFIIGWKKLAIFTE